MTRSLRFYPSKRRLTKTPQKKKQEKKNKKQKTCATIKVYLFLAKMVSE